MRDNLLPARADALIAGGGPCGLMLAIELGRRGVPAARRPDQMVAWRGNDGAEAAAVVARVSGS